MKEPVIISVEGTQKFVGEDMQKISMITEGTMEYSEEVVRLSYQESEISGMEGTTTSFVVRKDHVTLERTGAVKSKMEFKKGVKDVSLYDVGFGVMTIGVQARRLTNQLGPDGGHLEISYGIEIGDDARGLNTFVIDVHRTANPKRQEKRDVQ